MASKKPMRVIFTRPSEIITRLSRIPTAKSRFGDSKQFNTHVPCRTLLWVSPSAPSTSRQFTLMVFRISTHPRPSYPSGSWTSPEPPSVSLGNNKHNSSFIQRQISNTRVMPRKPRGFGGWPLTTTDFQTKNNSFKNLF